MVFEKVQAIIAKELNVSLDKITMDTHLVDDLGADSLDVLEIIMSIEDEFNIKIPTNGAENIVTVGDAFEAIKKVMNK